MVWHFIYVYMILFFISYFFINVLFHTCHIIEMFKRPKLTWEELTQNIPNLILLSPFSNDIVGWHTYIPTCSVVPNHDIFPNVASLDEPLKLRVHLKGITCGLKWSSRFGWYNLVLLWSNLIPCWRVGGASFEGLPWQQKHSIINTCTTSHQLLELQQLLSKYPTYD